MEQLTPSCGPHFGGAKCSGSACCSKYGWCYGTKGTKVVIVMIIKAQVFEELKVVNMMEQLLLQVDVVPILEVQNVLEVLVVVNGVGVVELGNQKFSLS